MIICFSGWVLNLPYENAIIHLYTLIFFYIDFIVYSRKILRERSFTTEGPTFDTYARLNVQIIISTIHFGGNVRSFNATERKTS